jgi:hypothetical protein
MSAVITLARVYCILRCARNSLTVLSADLYCDPLRKKTRHGCRSNMSFNH